MTLALFPFESFFATLPQLLNRRAVRRAPATAPTVSAAQRPPRHRPSAEHPAQSAIQFVAAPAISIGAVAQKSLKAQRNTPLRILRVVEPGDRAAGAGRMRMSGSMADVCAELDRLVERENQRANRLH